MRGSPSSTSPRGTPAVRERGRRATASPQRRDLQLPRAAASSSARATASARDRHRGGPRRLREWGERCVERFNGMWAFALWDARRRTLFCSRDRFGVKPFYYRWDGGRFVFASEPRGVPRRPTHAPREPNPRAVRDFIEQAYIDHPTRRSSREFASCRRPHSLTLDEHGLRIQRYWQLGTAGPAGRSCRRGSGAVPRLGPAAAAHRRPRRNGALRRARLVRDRGAPSTTCSATSASRHDSVGERQRDVHRLLRRSRASTSARMRSGRGDDGCRGALSLVHATTSSSTTCPRSSRRRTSRSARRASPRSGT